MRIISSGVGTKVNLRELRVLFLAILMLLLNACDLGKQSEGTFADERRLLF